MKPIKENIANSKDPLKEIIKLKYVIYASLTLVVLVAVGAVVEWITIMDL